MFCLLTEPAVVWHGHNLLDHKDQRVHRVHKDRKELRVHRDHKAQLVLKGLHQQ